MKPMTNQQLKKDQAKHFLFLEELKKRDGVLIPDKTIQRLKEEYQSTMVMVNDKPFKMHNHYLVKIYLNYCYSHPVYVYIKKEAFDYYHGWNVITN